MSRFVIAAGLAASLLAPVALAPPTAAAQGRGYSQDPAAAASGRYVLDKRHASLTGKVRHLGLSNYTFRFNVLDGELTYDRRTPAASRVSFTVDPASIDTGLPGFDRELAGEGWLNASVKGPARFISTGAVATGPRSGRVSGDLTISGVTRPASFNVTFNGGGLNARGTPTLGFTAKGVVRRSEFRIGAQLPTNVAADEVHLVLEAEFAKA